MCFKQGKKGKLWRFLICLGIILVSVVISYFLSNQIFPHPLESQNIEDKFSYNGTTITVKCGLAHIIDYDYTSKKFMCLCKNGTYPFTLGQRSTTELECKPKIEGGTKKFIVSIRLHKGEHTPIKSISSNYDPSINVRNTDFTENEPFYLNESGIYKLSISAQLKNGSDLENKNKRNPFFYVYENFYEYRIREEQHCATIWAVLIAIALGISSILISLFFFIWNCSFLSYNEEKNKEKRQQRKAKRQKRQEERRRKKELKNKKNKNLKNSEDGQKETPNPPSK